MTLTVAVLGLRGLKSSIKAHRLLNRTVYIESPSKPYVELDAGKTARPTRKPGGRRSLIAKAASKTEATLEGTVLGAGLKGAQSLRTSAQNTPSATSPCYMEARPMQSSNHAALLRVRDGRHPHRATARDSLAAHDCSALRMSRC